MAASKPKKDYLDEFLSEAPAESTAAPAPVSPRAGQAPPMSPEEAAFRASFGSGRPYSGAPDLPVEPATSPIDAAVLGIGTGGFGTLAAETLPAAVTSRLAPWALRLATGAASGAGAMGAYGAAEDIAAGHNPLPNLPGNLGMGAAAGTAFAGAGGLVRKAASKFRGTPPAAPSPAAIAAEEPQTLRITQPTEPAPAAPRLAPTGPSPKAQPFTGESAQQEAAPFADMMEQIRTDPEYLKHLNELGGGRVVSNAETMAKALEAGPMTVDELKGLRAGTLTNEVEVTRGMITKDYVQRKFIDAMARGDDKAAGGALDVLKEIEPGIQNLRATPGRATQSQAMFVEDRVARAYQELADMRAKGIPFDQIKAAADKKLREVARDAAFSGSVKRAAKAMNALETYATMAKLTSPITHAINTVSNAATFLVVRPLERMGTAAALAVQGDAPAARATMANLFGTTSGLRDGMKRYITTLMEDAPDLGKATEASTFNINFPKPLRWADPFRQLSGADAFWKGILEDSEMHTKAMTSALREGLTGKKLAARVTELMNDPPSAWRKAAQKVAQEVTFQEDPDKFLQAVSKLRRVPGMRLIIPFVNTPYNLWKYQFQRSPLGIMSPRNLRGLASGGEAQAEAFGRLAAGTGLALGAWALASRGEITGSYPEDPGERALWEAESIKPYSIKVGGRWQSYGRFQPVGQYLAGAAALKDALARDDDKTAQAHFTKLLFDSMRGITEQPFLQGMSSLIDAIDGKPGAANRFFSGTVTGLVPNAARDVRYQTDPVQRESRGIVPSVMNMVPGLSQKLPARVDVTGRDVRYDPNRLARFSKVSSLETPTPETRAYREAGYVPPRAPGVMRVKVAGERIALTPAERHDYEQQVGAETSLRVRRVISTEAFARMTQEQKAKKLRKAADGAREMVGNQWKRKLRNSGRAGKEKR